MAPPSPKEPKGPKQPKRPARPPRPGRPKRPAQPGRHGSGAPASRSSARPHRPSTGPKAPGAQPAADQRRAAEAEDEGIRLQKVLADAGLASRRRAEDLIREGRVKVNGRPAFLGQRAVVGRDRVELDGVPVYGPGERHYYAVNKPPGVVTTSRDPQGRTTVIDLLGVPERVFTVGRLDAETEGLIIVTDDGELAQRLTHPSFELSKTYVAEVVGIVRAGTIRKLVSAGVDIDGGLPAVADSARILDVTPGKSARTVVEIALHEGRNRVVRRMLQRAGHPVLRLARTGVGPLRLGRLATGTYRKLSPSEVTALYQASGRDAVLGAPGDGPRGGGRPSTSSVPTGDVPDRTQRRR